MDFKNFSTFSSSCFSKRLWETMLHLSFFKDTVTQIEKALINDHLRVSKIS